MSRPPLVFRPSTDTSASAESAHPPIPGRSGSTAAPPELTDDAYPEEAPYGSDESGGIESFATEQEIRFKTHRPASSGPSFLMIAVAATAVVGILGLTYLTLHRTSASAGAPATSEASAPAASPGAVPLGQAQFDSSPSGAEVLVDGVSRGRTPLKLALPIGTHTLELRGEAGSRTLPLTIQAGILVSQFVELAGTPASRTGRLEITSEPSGAQVLLDGVARGTTPLSLDAVDAREHAVTLNRAGTSVLRRVTVAAGATASVFAALGPGAPAAPGAVGGYLAFSVPFEVQVMENGRLIGTSSSERLMVPTGRHELELVNAGLQFRQTMTVSVEPGKTASPAVTIPDGTISINALPWADVSIDGRAVGQTPLANLSLPIGSHDVVWRHPQLGERRQRVTVTAQTPTRVGVNFAQ